MRIPVTMTSMISGKQNTMMFDMTREQINAYTDTKRTKLIQEIFPELTDAEREFLMTGITPAEWDATFPKEEEE
jgi:hypothetical protein